MSTNVLNVGPVSSSTASQGPNSVIRPFLNTFILSHTFLSLLIPLMISLFYFSTPQGRRQSIFVLNVVAVLLAFVVGVLCDALAIHGILKPLKPWPVTVNLAVGFIGVSQSICVNLSLLLRVIFVYPLAQVGVIHFSLLIAIPVLLKLTRVINVILLSQVLVQAMNRPNATEILANAFTLTPYIQIEWAAQMIDNTYASLVFLWKLHRQRSKRMETQTTKSTLTQRMRTLFNIALMNFVVPAMFSIIQFICIYRHVDAFVLNKLMLVNIMLATFGVAFATVWAGSTSRREAQALDSKRDNPTSSLEAVCASEHRHSMNQSSTHTANVEYGFAR